KKVAHPRKKATGEDEAAPVEVKPAATIVKPKPSEPTEAPEPLAPVAEVVVETKSPVVVPPPVLEPPAPPKPVVTPAPPVVTPPPPVSRPATPPRPEPKIVPYRPLERPAAPPPSRPGPRQPFAPPRVVSAPAGLVLFCAALLGDNVNYNIGKAIGPRVLSSEKSRVFNKKHLVKTERFYAKHGPKTVILARFVPIVRTFAPFVAGAGSMPYARFLMFSVVGAALWVTTMIGAGVLFGQL